MNLASLRAAFEWLLETIVIVLVCALTLLVICGFAALLGIWRVAKLEPAVVFRG